MKKPALRESISANAQENQKAKKNKTFASRNNHLPRPI